MAALNDINILIVGDIEDFSFYDKYFFYFQLKLLEKYKDTAVSSDRQYYNSKFNIYNNSNLEELASGIRFDLIVINKYNEKDKLFYKIPIYLQNLNDVGYLYLIPKPKQTINNFLPKIVSNENGFNITTGDQQIQQSFTNVSFDTDAYRIDMCENLSLLLNSLLEFVKNMNTTPIIDFNQLFNILFQNFSVEINPLLFQLNFYILFHKHIYIFINPNYSLASVNEQNKQNFESSIPTLKSNFKSNIREFISIVKGNTRTGSTNIISDFLINSGIFPDINNYCSNLKRVFID